MYPEAAGADAAWVTWAKEQKRGGAAAWRAARAASREALRQSAEGAGAGGAKASAALQKLPPLAADPRAWPWLAPAPAPAPAPTADFNPFADGATPAPAVAVVSAAGASLPTGDISIARALGNEERAARQPQVGLFDAATRRDCYNVLVAPAAPCDPAAQPSPATAAAAAGGGMPFEILLWMRAASAGTPAAYAFGPRGATPPAGFSVAADQTMLDALGKFGALEPHPMAVTVAFESFLSKLVASWRPHDVSRLSVNFLIAFGAELTRRLDVHHRIRSTKLSAAELATLRSLPFKNFVDLATLNTFQES